MITIVLAAALGLSQQQPALVPDSVYSSPALRAVVERAALRNAAPPPSLRSFKARAETELSFVQSQSDGRETPLQLEQLASDVYWRADGAMKQEIVGYRAQTLGASFSGLSFFEVPFVIPTLFADRLDLVRTTGPARSESGQLLRRRTLHPFARGREAVYSFSGGDTVDVIRLAKRTISIMRVHVTPRREPVRPTLLFEGDIDLDAERLHIVRMQGRLIATGRGSSFLSNFLQGVLYVRLENAEYDEEYWLPTVQRFEVQAVSRIGEGRTAFRGVTRIIDLVPNDESAMTRVASLNAFPYGQLTVGAMRDISRFSDWANRIGSISEETDVHDFDMFAPPSLQPHEQSRLTFGARYLSQLVRFNPVEGVYTGLGLGYRLSDNTRLRAHAGYAWNEKVARGGVEFAQRNGAWEYRARAERQLAHTSDFLGIQQADPGLTPIIAGDNYDFVDRRIAGLVARRFSDTGLSLRFEAARAGDRNVTRNISSVGDSLELTGLADEGAYWIGRAELQKNTSAGSFSLQPGLGWLVRYEAATGDLDWQRAEAGVTLRRTAGAFTFATRVDGGILMSDAPPAQTLFDFRNTATLPGFDDDDVFAGDRAAIGRAMVMYSLPILRSPVRLGSLFLPAPAPSPSVGFYAGWTDADAESQLVLDRLGWRTTNGTRSSIDLRMRFFGGGVSVGAARALDTGAKWKLVWGWASEF
ncbi:MAG: hypothetical protein ABIV28_02535 [Longimicrobiales bacterium]